MNYIKVILSFIIFHICYFESKAQSYQISELQCSGSIPADLKKTMGEFVNGQNDNKYSKGNLLGVYNILNSGNVLYGTPLNEMIERIGQRVLKTSGVDADVHFYILRSGIFNAFATDEGYIFATTALLAQLDSEDELAFILSHELSHFIFKHSLSRQIQKELTLKEINQLAKARRKSHNKEEDMELSLDAFLRTFYKYSRNQESQADSMGLNLYLRAGYDPAAVYGVFEKLEYAFPVFNKYHFQPQLVLPRNQEIAKAMTERCLLKSNSTAWEKLSLDFKLSEIEKTEDSLEQFYRTHEDNKARLQKLKMRLESAISTDSKPMNMELQFAAISEQFVYHMRSTNYGLALVYLNVLDQHQNGNIKNLDVWKSLVLYPLFLKKYNMGKQSIENDESGDAYSEFKRLFIALPTSEWYVSALHYCKLSSNDEPELMTRTKRRYLALLHKEMHVFTRSTDTTDISLSIRNCQGMEQTYNWERKHPIQFQGTLESMENVNGDATILVQNSKLDKKFARGNQSGFELPMANVGGPVFYLFRNKKKSMQYAQKMEDYVKYFSEEIVWAGKKNKLNFRNYNFQNKDSTSTEEYNFYHASMGMLVEKLELRNLNVIPVSTIINQEVFSNSGIQKLNFTFGVGKEWPKKAVTLFLAKQYSAMFCLPIGFNVSSWIEDNWGSRLVMVNMVLDAKSGNIDYQSEYSYSQDLRYDLFSGIAYRMSKDMKRYYKL
ncbi:MAG: M48 family metallopeptidase [Bacteroidetes bacterium]|nr:M48 family metallopeptidase [Bacteroidota bacterium]